jgi:hypothetical protein
MIPGIVSDASPVELSDASLRPSQMARAASLLASLLVSRGGARRRVERITFEEATAYRTLSLDLDLESSEEQIPVPVALFEKGQAMLASEAHDENGHVLPLLTAAEAGAVGYIALRLLAGLAEVPLAEEDERLLFDLASAPAEIASDSYRELCERDPAWQEDRRLASAARTLAEQVAVVTLVRSTGGRRTLRFAWQEHVSGGGPRTIGSALVGRSGTVLMTLRGFSSASDQIEVRAPTGTDITRAELVDLHSGRLIPASTGAESRLLASVPSEVAAGATLVITLSSSRMSRTIGIAALFATLAILVIAIAVPGVRNHTALLLGLLALPALVLLAGFGWLRSRDRGFGFVFAAAPLLVAITPLVVGGSLAIAGATEAVGALTALTVASGGLLAAGETAAIAERRAARGGATNPSADDD